MAANAIYAIDEIARLFEMQYGYSPEIVSGSSGKLTAQIIEGAPYHIFISADEKYPEVLFEKGYATKKPETYAYGKIVLWSMRQSNVFMEALAGSSVHKIALANPEVAPYGEAAIEALHFYRIYDMVKNKLVYGENISQVGQYVQAEAADAGLIAKSIVMSPELSGKGVWIELDTRAYMPIAQGVVLLKRSKETLCDESTEFYNFLFSAEAKRIFREYGYKVP